MKIQFVETIRETKTFRHRAWGTINTEVDSPDSVYRCRLSYWYLNTAPDTSQYPRVENRLVNWENTIIQPVEGEEIPNWIRERMSNRWAYV